MKKAKKKTDTRKKTSSSAGPDKSKKRELTDKELSKASGGAIDAYLWFNK